MYRSAVILVIFCVCSSFATYDDRIVKGKLAPINEFSYQCSIQEFRQHFCGGTVISPIFVLTAAHCFNGTKPSQIEDMQVRVGSSQWQAGGVVKKLKAWHMHPGWNNGTMVNDICLLELASPLILSASIKTIPLATETPNDGDIVTVSGWGATYEGRKDTPDLLQKTDLKFYRRETCASSKFKYAKGDILETMVCAHSVGTDSCQGDSGGPLVKVIDEIVQLVGVVSWGMGCAKFGYPGVYADVPQFVPWIMETMKKIEKENLLN